MNLLKNPKTPNEFQKKHTGASIAKQPGSVLAAMNEQGRQKIAAALNLILRKNDTTGN